MSIHTHAFQKVPVVSQRRLDTVNQRIALFRHLAQVIIKLTRSISQESLPKREKGRFHATCRLLIEELQRNRLRL